MATLFKRGSVVSRQAVFFGKLHTRSVSTLDISGIFPPIVTPFDDQEKIDFEKLKKNFDRWNSIPFKGYVVQGSNGEYPFLSSEERLELIKNVKKFVADGKLLIAGTGCESTLATIKLTKAAAEVGANAALVITPCYYKGQMKAENLIKHFQKVADESPIPIILYSVPQNTGIDLSADIVTKLAPHPNIIGLKDSQGEIIKLSLIAHKIKANGFQILAGSASFCLPALSVGCVGGVFALANVLGEECVQLHQLWKEGKQKEALKLQYRLIEPNSAVTRNFGVSGLKKAMTWFGYDAGGTRMPLIPLTSSEEIQLKEVFKKNGFLK